jgi:hypothetical protein
MRRDKTRQVRQGGEGGGGGDTVERTAPIVKHTIPTEGDTILTRQENKKWPRARSIQGQCQDKGKRLDKTTTEDNEKTTTQRNATWYKATQHNTRRHKRTTQLNIKQHNTTSEDKTRKTISTTGTSKKKND